jgi:hypothetical protein
MFTSKFRHLTAILTTYSSTLTFLPVSLYSRLGSASFPCPDERLEWVSGDRTAVAEWEYGVTSHGVAYHKVYRQTQLLFSEVRDQGEWGNWYWATEDSEKVTHQSGADVAVRGAFAANGTLGNSKDSNYRAISTNWPVFGFAIDLGSVTSSSVDTRFTIGLAQTEAIQYSSPDGIRAEPSLWTSYFDDDLAAVSALAI